MLRTLKDIDKSEVYELPELQNQHAIQTLERLNMDFWQTFHDTNLRQGFRQLLEDKSENAYKKTILYESMMRYVGLRDSSVYKKKLKSCTDIDSFTQCLLAMFENFSTFYSPVYKDVPFLMFEYLDYVLNREYELRNTLTEQSDVEVAPVKIKKNRKVAVTFPDGTELVKTPSVVMTRVIEYLGFDVVASKNIKLVNEPLLVHKPGREVVKYYHQVNDDWYLCTAGDTIAKFRILRFLNESLNAGLDIKLL